MIWLHTFFAIDSESCQRKFLVKNSSLALILNLSLSNPTVTILQAKNQFKVAKCDQSYNFF